MKNKNTVWLQVLLIYLICFCFRFIEYFFIRTDSTFFGEAFIHKLLGIVVLFVSAHLLLIKPVEIGFSHNRLPQNLLKGFLFGLCCYSLAYAVEIIILKNAGNFEKLSLFVTSYSVNGNLGNHTEAVFFLICILGNIINVVMEEGVFRGLFQKLFERRYSFWPAAIFASILFGLWHCVGPIRSFVDGDSNRMQLIMNLLILIGSSTLIGIKYAMLVRLTGSLYLGMADHFVNNTIINILHVVSPSEIDQLQTIRISIAQTISFVIVLIVYCCVMKKAEIITYRKAELQDCHKLAELKGLVWKTTYRGIYTNEALDNYDVEKNTQIFEQICKNPEIELYLAEVENEPIGLMTCGKPYKPIEGFSQEVGLLYILKEHQRKGIGKNLLQIAKNQVYENGFDRFVISVNKQNENAIAFYKKMGGIEVAEDEKQKRFCFMV